jgi:hypothetical protein
MIRIGNGVPYLTVTLLGRSHPDQTDYWDGNWLRAEVEVVAGGFRGLVSGDLRSDEFAHFRDALAILNESLRGEAEFATLERWLNVRAIGDGRGHVTFACEVRDEGARATLTCEFIDDQTCLASLLRQLDQALLLYPVIGHP